MRSVIQLRGAHGLEFGFEFGFFDGAGVAQWERVSAGGGLGLGGVGSGFGGGGRHGIFLLE